MELDYFKSPSVLYSLLERGLWTEALVRAKDYPDECSFWVVKRIDSGQVGWKLLPLHAAIKYGAPEETMGQILMSYPEGAACKDDNGNLPIHLALSKSCCVGFCTLLILSYPECCDVPDQNGCRPLDLANKSSEDFRDSYVCALAWAHRSSSEISLQQPLSKIDDETYDETPSALFLMITQRQWTEVKARAIEFPTECMSWVRRRKKSTDKLIWNLLPLHAATIYGAPEDVIRQLLISYPDSAKAQDDRGMLPIHFALITGSDVGVVIELLISFPDSIHVKDFLCRSPMDLVSSLVGTYRSLYRWALEWIQTFESQEKVSKIIKQYDRTKKHVNFSFEVDEDTKETGFLTSLLSSISSLWKKSDEDTQYTEAIADEESKGSMNIVGSFLADLFESKTNDNLFSLLQDCKWDEATSRAKDFPKECQTWITQNEEDGRLRWRILPIHAAIIYGAPERTVRQLLLSYRDGAKQQDDAGMLPIHLAFLNESSVGVVSLLIVSFRDSIFVKDNKGRLPFDCFRSSTAHLRKGYLFTLTWAMNESPVMPMVTIKNSQPRVQVFVENVQDGAGGSTKLFDLICQRKWLEASARATNYPEECKIFSSYEQDDGTLRWRILPIHGSVLFGAAESFVREMLSIYRDGSRFQDSNGMLPLHIALLNSCSIGIIMALMLAYPSAIAIKDNFDRLPIDIVKSSTSPYKKAYKWALEWVPSFKQEEDIQYDHKHSDYDESFEVNIPSLDESFMSDDSIELSEVYGLRVNDECIVVYPSSLDDTVRPNDVGDPMEDSRQTHSFRKLRNNRIGRNRHRN